MKLFFVAALAAGAAASGAASNETVPMQLRLAYAGPNGMIVSWNTYCKLDRPTVLFGEHPNQLNRRAFSDVSVTYPTSTTYNNHVKLDGLESNTLYYYLPEYSNTTNPYTFRTSREAGDKTPYSVAFVADLGTMGPDGLTTHVGTGAANPLQPGEINTIQSLANFQADYDFVWHSGDIAYADYWLKEEQQGFLPNTTTEEGAAVYERILNEFYDEMSAAVTSTKPYMVGPGNHEANCDNGKNLSICIPGQTNFTGYRNHFRMPSAESGGLENFWYSFDHGLTHFIQLDTETDLGHGIIAPDEPGGTENEDGGPFATLKDQQTNWLAADLAKVDRKKTPWIVVAVHRPWYIAAKNSSSNVCLTCQEVFEPIFIEYEVDLVLTGHVHVYQRNAPIANYTVDENGLQNPKAPLFITNGAAGHYDGLDTLLTPMPYYTEFATDTVYGWSKLIFHNCTHLTHQFVASGNATVLDEITLYKERKC